MFRNVFYWQKKTNEESWREKSLHWAIQGGKKNQFAWTQPHADEIAGSRNPTILWQLYWWRPWQSALCVRNGDFVQKITISDSMSIFPSIHGHTSKFYQFKSSCHMQMRLLAQEIHWWRPWQSVLCVWNGDFVQKVTISDFMSVFSSVHA